MTDAFDKVMAEIAINSAKNGGPGPSEILRAIEASHEAAAERLDVITELLAAKVDDDDFTEHCADAGAHDHTSLHASHMERHHYRAPRRKDDPPDADYRDAETTFQTRFMWAGGKWVVGILGAVAGGVVVAVLNAILTGRL